MDNTTAQVVPKEVVKKFEEFLGIKVDPSKILLAPDDGYSVPRHGCFDWYLLRRGGLIYKVRIYKNGEVQFE